MGVLCCGVGSSVETKLVLLSEEVHNILLWVLGKERLVEGGRLEEELEAEKAGEEQLQEGFS